MKKPAVTVSKKGAMFNILWLLIENPKNLKYFRVFDIKTLLNDEFGIVLDRKTIHEYLTILIDLQLPIEISHESNKGYYVSKRLLDHSERRILVNAINNEKSLDDFENYKLYDYILSDLPRNERNNFTFEEGKITLNKEHENGHSVLLNTLDILQKAIDEQRTIKFDYLTFNNSGKFNKKTIVYEVIPVKIKYSNGMYYLYSKEKLWVNAYVGIKIQYMRNIRLGDHINSESMLNLSLDYRLELGVVYDWTIELIDEFFDDYSIRRDKTVTKAIITAPYDMIIDWCKKYSPFFIIYDEKIKNHIRQNFIELIDTIEKKDEVLLNIKSTIVNYHYNNPITNKSDYNNYLLGVQKNISRYFKNLGYTYNPLKNIYGSSTDTIAIEVVDYCTTKKGYMDTNDMLNIDYDKELYKIILAKQKLIESNATNRYIVILYSYLKESENKKICDLFNVQALGDDFDQFSALAKAFYYKYSVIKIQ